VLDRMPASEDEKAGADAPKAAAVAAPARTAEGPAKAANPHEDGGGSHFSKW
jgi:hypothetical protein